VPKAQLDVGQMGKREGGRLEKWDVGVVPYEIRAI